MRPLFLPEYDLGAEALELGRANLAFTLLYLALKSLVCFSSGPIWGCDRLVSRAKVIENQDMAAPVISISSDVLVESMGSSFLRVILIDSISVEVPVAPEEGAAVVASPAGYNSESDTEMPGRHVSPTPYDAMLTRALTLRKSVRPLSSHRLALRYTSHHLDHFTSGSSLGHSSLDHSLSKHSILGLHGVVRPTAVRVPSRADLLISCKRLSDSISPEDSVEEDIDVDELANYEDDATAVKVVVDRDVVDGVKAGINMKVDVGVDVEDEVKDEVESSDRGTIEVRVDVVVGINIPNGMLMPDVVEYLE
ncbi:hypothetical protein Tco_1410849 [Tanacetum coccineum]